MSESFFVCPFFFWCFSLMFAELASFCLLSPGRTALSMNCSAFQQPNCTGAEKRKKKKKSEKNPKKSKKKLFCLCD